MKAAWTAGLIVCAGMWLVSTGCDSKEEKPPAATSEAGTTPTAKDDKPAGDKPAADKPAADTAAKADKPAADTAAKADKPAADTAAKADKPAADTAAKADTAAAADTAAKADTAAPADTAAKADTGAAGDTAKPGEYVLPAKKEIVRNPDPESPQGIIARALAAAMEPDFEKGWEQFEALLHTDEQLPNALTSRKQLNFPAMRRKVKLFLAEDETKPIYQVAYIVDRGEKGLKFFVHNKKSMPTPCHVQKDPEQDNKWRIKTCSL